MSKYTCINLLMMQHPVQKRPLDKSLRDHRFSIDLFFNDFRHQNWDMIIIDYALTYH